MDYKRLSKEISYALRHAPWEYELEMDEEGFVKIYQLLSSLTNYERDIRQSDIQHIIDISEKQRFEIVGDKVRALYGHSIPMHIKKVPGEPPEVLYHGTAKRTIDLIKESGLLPMNRQYVHFSVDTDMAKSVGSRRDSKPAILVIKSKEAYNDGVPFYIGNEHVWLCDKLPSKYIDWENIIWV